MFKTKADNALFEANKRKEAIIQTVDSKRTALGTLREDIDRLHNEYKERLSAGADTEDLDQTVIKTEYRYKAEQAILRDLEDDLAAATDAAQQAEYEMFLAQYERFCEKRRDKNRAIEKAINTLIRQMEDLKDLDHEQRMCGLKTGITIKYNRTPLNHIANYAIANLRGYFPIEGHAYPAFRDRSLNDLDLMVTPPTPTTKGGEHT